MKQEKEISRIIATTMIQGIIVLMISSCFSTASFAQKINVKKEYSFETKEVEEYVMTSFSAKHINGKVYIMWTVIEPSADCTYRLERSTNGKDYTPIYVLTGAKSPNGRELLNSFVDKVSTSSKLYYRVRRDNKKDVVVSNSFVLDHGTAVGSIVQNNSALLATLKKPETHFVRIDCKKD